MNNETLNDLIFGAFRYALGRRTYYVQTTVNIIIDNWGKLSGRMKYLIRNEIKEAIKNDNAGDACDIVEWNRILDN